MSLASGRSWSATRLQTMCSGYETTLPVTIEELLPLVRAVVRSARRAFVIGDLPFGTYEDGPSQALQTSIRFMKEGGCHAVKFEGGVRVAPQIRKVIEAGIPVMGHVGFTPQSEHQLGGYRVQGRGPPRKSCWPTLMRSRTRGPSAWCWRWCPATWPSR